MQQQIATLARRMQSGGRNVFFTGAGISTESGISDYRSQGGLWQRFQPIYFDAFMSDRRARIEYWRRATELARELERARPNPAHRALARFHRQGLLEAVITQNIDGLHQEAGLPDEAVIELHGNTRRARCMTCGAVSPMAAALGRIAAGDPAPECPCGGYLKPNTVSFGQAMPMDKVAAAERLARRSDLLVVVGSTLVVQPAALMPGYAKESGAYLAIINLSETPYDGVCDLLIRAKAGDVLKALADGVETARA